MLYILVSADYELFMGINLVPEEQVLIEPTERLLETCEAAGAPLNIFADVACLWRYRQLGMEEFPELAERQMRDAVRRGHDVQTHMHSHWLSARQEDGRWQAPAKDYMLGTMFPDRCREASAELLERARRHLEELLTPVDPGYRCLAFRAGGYGLQPQEHEIIAALGDAGYVIDSSIMPDLVLLTGYTEVDFRSLPAMANWRLSPEAGLGHDPAGRIWEIPIASYRERPLDRAARIARRLMGGAGAAPPARREPPRGLPVLAMEAAGRGGTPTRLGRALRTFAPKRYELEISGRLSEMKRVTELYLRQRRPAGADMFFAMTSHPKGLYETEFENLARYCQWLRRRWPGEVEFITYRRAAELLGDA